MSEFGKWTPVTDRLPDPEGDKLYLVTVAHFNPAYKSRRVVVSDYDARDYESEPTWGGSVNRDGIRVVAWMPLPDPYFFEGGDK